MGDSRDSEVPLRVTVSEMEAFIDLEVEMEDLSENRIKLFSTALKSEGLVSRAFRMGSEDLTDYKSQFFIDLEPRYYKYALGMLRGYGWQ